LWIDKEKKIKRVRRSESRHEEGLAGSDIKFESKKAGIREGARGCPALGVLKGPRSGKTTTEGEEGGVFASLRREKGGPPALR